MSELNDRRVRKKARTRTEIRSAAQRLFAERGFDCVTIADVAAEADVAVQTVFNHFATKEELFFDGRTPWVDGAAESVRNRAASEPPLTALKTYLVALVGELAEALATEERRCFIATLEASQALRTRELELVHETERRLTEALTEALTEGPSQDDAAPSAAGDPATAAALTSATWLAVVRVLLMGQRPLPADSSGPLPADSSGDARPASAVGTPDVGALTDAMLGRLEQGLGAARLPPADAGPGITGRPGEIRRAG